MATHHCFAIAPPSWGGLTLLAVGWRLVGLPTALACVVLWQGVVTLLIDSPVAHSLEPGGIAWTRVRSFWRLNWPLGGTAALISLMSYTPRYALLWAGGETWVGDYAALGQIALLGNLVVQGAGQASLARLGTGFVRDRALFVQVVRELSLLAAAVALCGIMGAVLWGDLLLAVIFQSRFGNLSTALVGMMGASLFVYAASVFGYALTAAGVKGPQLTIFGVSLAVGVGTSFPLSAAYGLPDAVAANVCCWATAAVLSGLLLRNICREGKRGESPHVGRLDHRVDQGGAV